MPPSPATIHEAGTWPAGAASRRMAVTFRARTELGRLRTERWPHVVLLSWPLGAVLIPARVFDAGPYDAIVAHVGGCPVYADLRELALHPHHQAILDARRRTSDTPPVVRLVPATAPTGPGPR